ncbi:tyrosine-type recombinase/integrase, partial [Candidatus Omnitrophota bacterium]
MAMGSITTYCKICRKRWIKRPSTCRHKEISYSVVYRVNGKQKWESTGPNKKDAERRLSEVMSQIHQGNYLEEKRVTFGEFAKRWLREYAYISVRPTTYKGYESYLRCHILPAFESMQVSKIKAQHIQSFMADKLKDLSPKTVRGLLVQLKIMFKYARRWELIRQSPTDDVDHVKDRHKEMDFLTTEEFRLLLKYAEGTSKLIIMLAGLTGMRRAEVFGLQWGDIDFNSNTIHVRRSLYWHQGKGLNVDTSIKTWHFAAPKSRYSQRAIVMSPSLRKALEIHRITAPVNQHDLIFCNNEGNPIDPSNFIQREYNPTFVRAGLRRVSFHALRHTYASL